MRALLLGIILAVAGCATAPSSGRGLELTSDEPKGISVAKSQVYGKSHAVVIGINAYETLPTLTGAVADARQVTRALERRGFEVVTVLDDQATRTRLAGLLGDELPRKLAANDRVLIYFAGHGVSVGPTGREMGYLMPVEGHKDSPIGTGLSMGELQSWLASYESKHVMFVADACYSGLALSSRSTGIPTVSPSYLNDITSRPVRFALVASGDDQEAGEWQNHGIFTRLFLEALEGSADGNHDGLVTSDEIATYVKPRVAEAAAARGGAQTPQAGRTGLGEFVFFNEVSAQPAADLGADTDQDPLAALKQQCAGGDLAAGEKLLTKLRARRLDSDAPSYHAHRATLLRSCTDGCASSCLELAHVAFGNAESAEFYRLACLGGKALGCMRMVAQTDDARRTQSTQMKLLCNKGDPLACAFQARESGDEAAASRHFDSACLAGYLNACETLVKKSVDSHARHVTRWEQLTKTERAACEANDAMACNSLAWEHCGVMGQCESEIGTAAEKAVRLAPIAGIVDTLAVVYCHSGRKKASNEQLDTSCDKGMTENCTRRCQELEPGVFVVVSKAAESTIRAVAKKIAARGPSARTWYPLLSVLEGEDLEQFRKTFEKKGGDPWPVTPGGRALHVPADVKKAHPKLVDAISRAPSMDENECQYWIDVLPIMSDEQVENLRTILANERSAALLARGHVGPATFVARMRVSYGAYRAEAATPGE